MRRMTRRRRRRLLLLMTMCAVVVVFTMEILTENADLSERKERGLSFVWNWLVRAVTSPPPPKFHITLVTAFLDIGKFIKGHKQNKRDNNTYKSWATVFSRVISPVVLYTDSEEFARHFLSVRRELLNVTKVILVRREGLWSFRLRDRIAAIYSSGRLPRHYPNTVYPDYACLTHAKFEFLMDAAENPAFPSRMLAWMDVGYLRNWVDRKFTRYYNLMPPKRNLDPTRVLCTQVSEPNFTLPWQKIFQKNMNWVAGGFFLATPDVMREFSMQYRRAVTTFLGQNMSQVEQQIIYSMYTESGRSLVKPTVELQVVVGGWFSLGVRALVPSNSTQLIQ